MTIRAVIVDDEPLARRRIRGLLAEAGDVEVVAECANGREAIRVIEESPPDLLFLDIQMPEIDGFDVLRAIGAGRVPVVIFVTAYDQFALRAFEAQALDYLLKPFDDERFEAALHRARERIRQQAGGDLDRRLRALLEEVRGGRGYLQRLVVPTGNRSVFVRTEEIDWIEAERNYIRLHAGGAVLPAAREPGPHRVRAGPGAVLPHPPLHHRERRPHPGRRIALGRRVPDGAPRWDEAVLRPQLPPQRARPPGEGGLSRGVRTSRRPPATGRWAGHRPPRSRAARLWTTRRRWAALMIPAPPR
ncbi:MAG TPA: response regulator [Longimicrobium sp.]